MTIDRRHMSPFQFSQDETGAPRLADFPSLTLDTVEGQGTVTSRDWAKELGMPMYYEEWENLARIRSDRLQGRVTFLLCDESETRLRDSPRLKPRQLALPALCSVELGHEGFLIGSIRAYYLGIDTLRSTIPSWLNLTLPSEIQGDYLLAEASLFDSALAEKAMEGVQRGLLSHCCPVLFRPSGAPEGTGLIIQVSLVAGDFPGIANAKVLAWST